MVSFISISVGRNVGLLALAVASFFVRSSALAAASVLQSQTGSFSGGGFINNAPYMAFSDYGGAGTVKDIDVNALVYEFDYAFTTNISGAPLSFQESFDPSYRILATPGDPAALSALDMLTVSIPSTSQLFQNVPSNATVSFFPGFTYGTISLALTNTADIQEFLGGGQYWLQPFGSTFLIENFLTPNLHTSPTTTTYFASESGAVTVSYLGDPAVPPSPIPEPGAWMLLVGGVATMGAHMRRRFRSGQVG